MCPPAVYCILAGRSARPNPTPYQDAIIKYGNLPWSSFNLRHQKSHRGVNVPASSAVTTEPRLLQIISAFSHWLQIPPP